MAEAQAYATSGSTAYVGQIITVVDEQNKSTGVYIISNIDGDLVNLLQSSGTEEIESISNEELDLMINDNE